jgi:hypothetical protein
MTLKTTLTNDCVFDCKISFSKLFPKENPDNWNKFFYEHDTILVRIELSKEYNEPLKGSASLTIIPSDVDQEDLWEASRLAGEWTFWFMLNILLVPVNNEMGKGFELNLSFGQNSFFDNDFENIHTIELRKKNIFKVKLSNLNPTDFDNPRKKRVALDEVFKILALEFDAEKVELDQLNYKPLRL